MSVAKNFLNLIDGFLEEFKIKRISGGIVVNKDITPVKLKEMSNKYPVLHKIRNRRWSSVFYIIKVKNKYYLYHLMFDPEEFNSGALNVERANNIRFIGIFDSANKAMVYLKGENLKFDLPQDKSIALHPQKPWTSKEMGI